MGFPVPGDAIEQNLDLNRYLIHNPASTFFMRVEGNLQTNAEVQPGDLLVVDRSLVAKNQSLVVAVIAGQLTVLRICKHQDKWIPADRDGAATTAPDLDIWGVVTTLIRKR
ncbi:MAG: DNA repair protein [Leptolyngbya sp. SIO1E4]|nr:DNA repair protein [Leptolyngbya sp. SIO1E4]